MKIERNQISTQAISQAQSQTRDPGVSPSSHSYPCYYIIILAVLCCSWVFYTQRVLHCFLSNTTNCLTDCIMLQLLLSLLECSICNMFQSVNSIYQLITFEKLHSPALYRDSHGNSAMCFCVRFVLVLSLHSSCYWSVIMCTCVSLSSG